MLDSGKDKIRATYEKLYDIVDGNLQKNGAKEKLEISKGAFLYSVSSEPGIADVSEMLRYKDNMEFLNIAYLGLLNRTVDETARQYWKQRKDEKTEDFQYSVVQSLLASPEFLFKGVKVVHNPWENEKVFRTKLLQSLSKIYDRFPLNLKIKVKNVYKKMIGYK